MRHSATIAVQKSVTAATLSGLIFPASRAGRRRPTHRKTSRPTKSGLAYFLFFLPLIICPESRYARYHANQGLVLLIVSALGSIVLAIIPIIGWILSPIFGLGVLVLAILGLVNGLNGQAKELPLIGKWQILH